jgi:hypothetical protein
MGRARLSAVLQFNMKKNHARDSDLHGRARLSAVPQFVAEIEGFSPWGTLFFLIQLTLTARNPYPIDFSPVPLRHG